MLPTSPVRRTPVRRTPVRRTLLAALVALAPAALAPNGARAQAVGTDPGTPYVASALSGFATTGAGMGGMRVTAWFADGSSSSGSWADLGSSVWGVRTGRFELIVGETLDTYESSWLLANGSASGLTRLLLEGAPGGTVFDLTFLTLGTPGSALGRSFTTYFPDQHRTTATYRNLVRVGAAPAVGDLYERLDLTFGIPVSAGLEFRADTDNIAAGGSITPVPTTTPEPASVALLAAGALVLGGVARGRRRAA